jgi:hypothetical protein
MKLFSQQFYTHGILLYVKVSLLECDQNMQKLLIELNNAARKSLININTHQKPT